MSKDRERVVSRRADGARAIKRKYTVIIEKDEDGWLVSDVVGLAGCHTQAKSMDELLARTKEAIRAYLDTEEIVISDEFVGVQQIEA